MSEEDKALIEKYCIFAFFAIALGAAAGAFYCLWSGGSDMSDMKEYIKNSLTYIANGADKRAIAMKGVYANIATFVVFLVCAAVRTAGTAIIALELARRGFICGFTAFAVMASFRAAGVPIALAASLQNIVFMPVAVLFAAVTALVSLRRVKISKKFIYFFAIFSIAVFTIFCGSAFAEGYITTIFMKLLAGLAV